MDKRKYNKKWKASKKPSKQRKYRINAPLHIKRKFLSANLTKPLRRKYLRRNFPLRKGDTIKVMRGKFKGKTGKVLTVNTRKSRVFLEGIQVAKKDGTKTNVHFDPSNLQIVELTLEDRKRKVAVERNIKK